MKCFIRILTLLIISSVSYGAVEPEVLSLETQKRSQMVPEFAYILEVAEELNVDVYLFGGTAAAFAHYVRWDLEREAGDLKYQAERFDYDYTNIYRGNQDLDIVVDGSQSKIEDFEKRLQKKYPHFVGSKSAWEVRSLRKDRGDKLALLNNPEFLNQHTDSNSIGMIHLNSQDPQKVYRSLTYWENKKSEFLTDIAEGRVKFLFNQNHKKTKRYKEGLNPTILSAVRFIAKVAQYEVEASSEDLETVKTIVSKTNWRDLSRYAKKKIAQFALKALLNAPNSEFAWNLLEKAGLRTKLIELDGNRIDEVESFSWWMNKEPLRSKNFGRKGLTGADLAQELEVNEVIVSHETNSFMAYDNITRSARGEANAFISREDVEGEAATLGDGFYVQLGHSGARGTNLTIRFKLHPEAREGHDFKRDGSYLIIKNKRALILIQENLNLSIKDFLILLMNGDIEENDRGLVEKFKRKFGRIDVKSEEFKEAQAFLLDSVVISEDFPEHLRFSYKNLDLNSFQGLMKFVVKNHRDKYFKKIIEEGFEWITQTQWIENWINIDPGKDSMEFIAQLLSQPRWKNHEDLAFLILDKVGFSREQFEKGEFFEYELFYNEFGFDLFALMLNHKAIWNNEKFLKWIFSEAILWSPGGFELLHDLNAFSYWRAIKFSSHEKNFVKKINWLENLDLMEEPLKQGELPLVFFYDVLPKLNPDEHPQIVKALKSGFKKQPISMVYYVKYVLNHPRWIHREDIVELLVKFVQKNKKALNSEKYDHQEEGLISLNLLKHPLVKKNKEWYLMALEVVVKNVVGRNGRHGSIYHNFSDFDLDPNDIDHVTFLNRLIQEYKSKRESFSEVSVKLLAEYLFKHPEITSKLDLTPLSKSDHLYFKIIYLHHTKVKKTTKKFIDNLIKKEHLFDKLESSNLLLKLFVHTPHFPKYYLDQSKNLVKMNEDYYENIDNYDSEFKEIDSWDKDRALVIGSHRDFLLALLKQDYTSYALIKFVLSKEQYLNDLEVLQEGLRIMLYISRLGPTGLIVFNEYVELVLMKSALFSVNELEFILKNYLGIEGVEKGWLNQDDRNRFLSVEHNEIVDRLLTHPNIIHDKKLQTISGSELLDREAILDYLEWNRRLTPEPFMCYEIL